MAENMNPSNQSNEINAIMSLIQYAVVASSERKMNFRIQKEYAFPLLIFWFVKENQNMKYVVATDRLPQVTDIGEYLQGMRTSMDALEDKIRRYKTYNSK